MRFFMARDVNLMGIDNHNLEVDLSSLPSTIRHITYDTNQGEIEYNNLAIAIREPFVDPTPYIPHVDAWLTKANTLIPPITVGQARTVKTAFVDILFAGKTQLPINVSGTLYDARDETVKRMLADSVTSGGLVATINARIADFNSLVSTFNTNVASSIAAFNSQVTAFNTAVNGFDATINAYSTDLDAKLTANFTSLNSGSYHDAIETALAVDPPSGGFDDQSLDANYGSVSGIGSFIPSITAFPSLGSFPTVTVTTDLTGQILSAISARTLTLQSVWAAKKAAIAALSTVASVIAYDVTAGW